MVIEEPSFLAPTTTPSIAPSFSELICPLSAKPGEFAALLRRGANKNEAIASIPATARSAAFFMRTSSDSARLSGTSESTLRLKLKYTQGTPQNNASRASILFVAQVAARASCAARPEALPDISRAKNEICHPERVRTPDVFGGRTKARDLLLLGD